MFPSLEIHMRSRRPVTDRRNRLVVFIAGDDTQVLDLAGPVEVFARCTRIHAAEESSSAPPYRVKVLSLRKRGVITTTAGLTIQVEGAYSELRETPDTLLVVGGARMEDLAFDREFVPWLRRQSKGVRRIGAVCTGAFALAQAGLLDGKRATTHWAWARRLAEMFPNVIVDPDPIHTRDHGIYTSGGVTAGMDLALAMVEEDYGPELSLRVARELVLFLRRPGSQSQFSAPLADQLSDREPIRELQQWLPGHLKERLTIPQLANRAGMSPRNFARVFTRDVGMTPGEYVDRLRLELASVRLSQSTHGLARIAAECGYGSPEVLRRTMRRVLNVTPRAYRARFGSKGSES